MPSVTFSRTSLSPIFTVQLALLLAQRGGEAGVHFQQRAAHILLRHHGDLVGLLEDKQQHGPRTLDTAKAWDTFMTLTATAKKLGVSI